MLFEQLSQQGQLYPELAEIRTANPAVVNGQFDQALAANPAAVQFAAEAEAWLSHFEAAAPAARALAVAYPGRREFTGKASALYRSLAAYDPRNTEIAVSISAREQSANPREAGILARMGDILADRELFTRARVYWERMPATQPGNPEAYLDAATVYWDYYRYNDALRWIATARKQFDDPTRFAWQAGGQWYRTADDTWRIDMTDAPTRKVAGYWQRLVDQDLVRVEPVDSQQWRAHLRSGETVGYMAGAWAAGAWAADGWGETVGAGREGETAGRQAGVAWRTT